ncbi:MarR family transcriptional regulator [Streptomyces sp. NPDC026672]|uniref:MarR family winged helix-turn-helix transcriptional regulator n=1 Tax=unclassified Streptomyces TaxID=2593676 RepID=UPI0033D08FC7
MVRKADLLVDILASVHEISRLRRRSADARFGTRTTLLATLEAIRESGGARISQLADRLAIDTSVLSRRIAPLKKRGWVVQVTDPKDRRAQLITLSDSGRSMLDDLRAETGASMVAGLPDWKVADLKALAAQLQRLEADLSKLAGETDDR